MERIEGRAATILDVSRRASSSRSTVSRYFNDPASVSPEAAERIRAAAEELQYSPSPTARALRRGRSRTISLLVGDLGQPFIAELAHALNRVARAQQLQLAVLEHSRRTELLPEMLDQFDTTTSRAVIVVTANDLDTLVVRQSLENLRQRGVPVITALQHLEGMQIPAITQDYEEIAHSATTRLADDGHTKIALCIPDEAGPYGRPLMQGYARALDERRLSPNLRSLWVAYDGSRLDQPELEALLRDGYTGFVCVGYSQIMAVNAALRDLDLHERLALLSCEWVPLLELVRPRVSSYSIDYDEFAAELLRTVLSEHPSIDHRLLPVMERPVLS